MLSIAKRHVQKLIEKETGADFRLATEAFALDAVWHVALGTDDSQPSTAPIPSILAQAVDLAENFGNWFFRHSLYNLLSWKSFQDPDWVEKDVRDKIDNVLMAMIDKHLDKTGQDSAASDDQRQSLLQRVSEQAGGSDSCSATSDVMAQARQVFTLGHEPSTLVLFWAIYELSHHPDVLERMRAEIGENLSGSGDLTSDAIRRMPYLDAVVTEILRLHPPISSTARLTTQPITVQTRDKHAVVFPEGSIIISSIHLLHHDEQLWGDTANTFLPERWNTLHRNSMENRCEYLPFLAGPRSCPSSNFAILQLKTMLVEFFRRANVEFVEGNDFAKYIGAVVRPEKPVPFTVRAI